MRLFILQNQIHKTRTLFRMILATVFSVGLAVGMRVGIDEGFEVGSIVGCKLGLSVTAQDKINQR